MRGTKTPGKQTWKGAALPAGTRQNVQQNYVFPVLQVSYCALHGFLAKLDSLFLAALPGNRFGRGDMKMERAMLIRDGRRDCAQLGTFYERYSPFFSPMKVLRFVFPLQ